MLGLVLKRNLFEKLCELRRFNFFLIRHSCILDHSPNAKLDKSLIDRYLALPMPECKIQAQYIWIDGTNEHVRSKTRTLDFIPACPEEVPTWTFDGNHAYMPNDKISDVYLMPVALYNDPIRGGNNKLVLCDTYDSEKKPSKSNHRAKCLEAMNCICEEEPQWGLEQKYQLMDVDGRPFGWPIMHGDPKQHNFYYCGVGTKYAYGREIIEAHYRACLYAGIDLAGCNAAAVACQWEYQVGVTPGIKAADDLWASRFLLVRIAEEYGIHISFRPKLYPNWRGAGLHCHLSTKKTRCDNGIKEIEAAIEKLSQKHKEHIAVYDPKGGKDNKARLTGRHKTSSIDKFTWAVAKRGVSVRIPITVADKKKGHFEDRRPAANADPYAVCNIIVRTIFLD